MEGLACADATHWNDQQGQEGGHDDTEHQGDGHAIEDRIGQDEQGAQHERQRRDNDRSGPRLAGEDHRLTDRMPPGHHFARELDQ